MSQETDSEERLKRLIAFALIGSAVVYLGYYLMYEADSAFKNTVATALFAVIIGGIAASFQHFGLIKNGKK